MPSTLPQRKSLPCLVDHAQEPNGCHQRALRIVAFPASPSAAMVFRSDHRVALQPISGTLTRHILARRTMFDQR
jgi:hypothetical protein